MLITDVSRYEAAIQELNRHDTRPIAWDLETTGKDWRGNRLCGVGAYAGGASYYFAFRHREGPNLPEGLIQDLFARCLRPDRPQVTYHGSYDVKVAHHHDGIPLPDTDVFHDALLAALLMNENEPSFKMEDLAKRYVDKNAGEQDEALVNYLHDRFGGSRKEAKQHLWKAPASVVAGYGMQDVVTTDALLSFYEPHLKTWRLWNLYREMCEYQIRIAQMELRGIRIDTERMPVLASEAEERAAALKARIQELAGYPLNPGSPKQLSAWLGVQSTAKPVLKRIENDERPGLILQWRGWSKATSTYYKPYSVFVDSKGILRCNLHITSPGTSTRGRDDSRNGTIAGRLSSSKPNLQQIPKESDTYKVKELFRARPGFRLVELDFSQAELRVAAHYSKDQRLTALLLAGLDMHAEVAREMNVPRAIAKNMNFSAWYGIGYRTFARNYFLAENVARDYLSRYHKMFPGIKRLYNALEHQASTNGYIRLYSGRLRRYNCVESPTHKASNNLIQGTVAEMIRIAFCRACREVPEALPVLQVHDSIWYEIPEEGWLGIVERLRAIMQDQPGFSLPMIVDAKATREAGGSLGDVIELPRSTVGIPAEALTRCTDPTIMAA